MTDRQRRVVVTGMAINTHIGDNLDDYYNNLMAGKSGICSWKCVDTKGIYSKIGGDISDYDWKAKLGRLKEVIPEETYKTLRRLIKKAPFSTRLSALTAVDAHADAGLFGKIEPHEQVAIVGGHNLNKNYQYQNQLQFDEEPDYIDSLASLLSLDTDHAGTVAEVLKIHGSIYTMGGACASGNIALRSAVDEIRHHGYEVATVVGAALEYAPMDLHAMAIMGAISFQSFNEDPTRASRPYDTAREGFIPSHGTATLVLESLEHAQARGARIYAEILGVTAGSDGSHLPAPSVEGQMRTMQRLLKGANVRPDQVNFVSAHATSTPLGDLTELAAIRNVFGEHATSKKLKVNAPKSMLGHTCWSAPTVETVAAILQMQRGRVHGTINIENLDPEVDLDVCANGPQDLDIEYMMKNSFGFGGINCCSLIAKFHE